MNTILIVDDEKNIREGLKKALQPSNYHIFLAANGKEALDIIVKEKINLAILDIQLPQMSGTELFHKINALEEDLPVIFITGHGSVETAVTAMRNGAFDFLTKPINLEKLELVVAKALKISTIQKKQNALILQVKSFEVEKLILGYSKPIKKLLNTIKLIAKARGNVYIYGESGTGKELVCDSIHHLANQKKPLVKVNCAALTPTLLESELFGHVKGAFTGADRDKTGRFEQANGGTIFIDEVSEIPLYTQVKLLRVIQEKQLERVGSGKVINIDIRIISASNKNLKEEVKAGRFREDLFYRLNVLDIVVPPLREREGDIEFLSKHFFDYYLNENDKEAVISPKVYTAFNNYPWPGNIRELRNIVEKIVVFCQNKKIDLKDIPADIRKSSNLKEHYEIPFGLTLEEIEKKIILETINFCGGNKSETAKLLKINRKKIYNVMSKG